MNDDKYKEIEESYKRASEGKDYPYAGWINGKFYIIDNPTDYPKYEPPGEED